jgi:uncharacterized protein YcnI
MRLRTIALVTALIALVIPAAAAAHVTVQPNEAAAGGFTRLNIRVPSESDTASTTKVDVKLPDGFLFVSYEPVPGWTVKLKKEKLATPVKEGDDVSTEQITQVTFTGDGKQGKIAPGQFQDFGLSVGVPDKPAGTKLTFPAVQTYDDGKVARWIGAPDAAEPAPQVTLTAAGAAHGAAPPAKSTATMPAAAKTSDDSSDTLAIIALAVGVLGLLAGGAALAASRRSRVTA